MAGMLPSSLTGWVDYMFFAAGITIGAIILQPVANNLQSALQRK